MAPDTDTRVTPVGLSVPKYQTPPDETRVRVGNVVAFWTTPTKPQYQECCWSVECGDCGWRLSGYVRKRTAENVAKAHRCGGGHA